MTWSLTSGMIWTTCWELSRYCDKLQGPQGFFGRSRSWFHVWDWHWGYWETCHAHSCPPSKSQIQRSRWTSHTAVGKKNIIFGCPEKNETSYTWSLLRSRNRGSRNRGDPLGGSIATSVATVGDPYREYLGSDPYLYRIRIFSDPGAEMRSFHFIKYIFSSNIFLLIY